MSLFKKFNKIVSILDNYLVIKSVWQKKIDQLIYSFIHFSVFLKSFIFKMISFNILFIKHNNSKKKKKNQLKTTS